MWSNDLHFLSYVEQNNNDNYSHLNQKKLVLCAMSNIACDENKKYNIAVHLIDKGVKGELFSLYAIQSSEPLLKYLVENELFNLQFNIGSLNINDYIKLSPNFIHPFLKYILYNKKNELFVHCFNDDLIKLEACLNSGFYDLNYTFADFIGNIYDYCKNNNKINCLELVLKYS